VRFIPVGTGNTSTLDKRLSRTAVHPRGHGEHSASLHTRRIRSGSSPWARGTLNSIYLYDYFPTVHPRGHGEHRKRSTNWTQNNGSSPWARGTLTDQRINARGVRFIPVGTGNTQSRKNVAC